LSAAAALVALPRSRPVHQDAAHGLSGGAKEVTVIGETLLVGLLHQPQVGIVNQCRGLERPV